MARATLQSRPRVIPVRACRACERVQDVFHLTMAGKHWLCAPCYEARRSTLVAERARPAAAAAFAGPGRRDAKISKTVAELERLDTLLRWIGIALKSAFYLGCVVLAERHPLIHALMLGVLVGDSLAWVGQAWFDRCFHALAVSTEAVLYTVVFVVTWQAGMFDWPEDAAGHAIATAALLGTATLKGVRFWHKLCIGDD